MPSSILPPSLRSRLAGAAFVLLFAGAPACSGAPTPGRAAQAPGSPEPVAAAGPVEPLAPSTAAPTASAPAATPPTAPVRPPGRPSGVSCAGPARPEVTTARVASMLQGDDDWPVDAIRALAPSVLGPLVELATSSRDAYVRNRAIGMLGALRCPDTAPAVERLLTDRDAAVRMYATIALTEIRGGAATGVLVRMLGDGDTGVLESAVRGLRDVGDASALPALERFGATTPHAFLRDAAAQARAAIGGRVGR